MIKKMLSALAVFCCLSAAAEAQENVKKLPAPQTTGGIPLLEAIHNRKTTREFSAEKIDEQTLSDILYAAWGISHDGKRTIPTSQNKQNLAVYAVLPDGIWLYDAETNRLTLAGRADLKPFLNTQDFMNDAPLTLIFTGSDAKNSPMQAGAAFQNVGLYAASRGLNNVVRGWIDRDGIAKALNLKPEEVIITQTIGWPYK